jgi:hypothetical protein
MNEIWLNMIEQELSARREQAQVEALLRQRRLAATSKSPSTGTKPVARPSGRSKASPDA